MNATRPPHDASHGSRSPDPTPEGEASAAAEAHTADYTRPSPGSTKDSQRMLLIAIVISGLAHVAVGWVALDTPLDKLDPRRLRDDRGVIHIRRATRDLVLDRATTRSGNFAKPSQRHSTSAQLSLALLDSGQVPKGIADRPMDPFEPASWRQPAGAPSHDVNAMSSVDLPEDVEKQLAAGDYRALGFVIDPPTDAQGSARGGDPARTTTGLAHRLLASHHQVSPARQRISLLDQQGLVQKIQMRPPLMETREALQRLDLSHAALEATTRLNLPKHLDNDFQYMLTTFKEEEEPQGFWQWDQAPRDTSSYLRVDVTAQRTLRKLHTMAKDVVFIIDTSGSVPKDWMAGVVRGVDDALSSLNDGDRFNIVFFNESSRFLSSETVLPVDSQTLTLAREFLRGAQSTGYTDMNQALSRLLVRDVDPHRVHNLILISDGRPTRGVRDTRELINLITRDNDLTASIYCVGIGGRQNRQMLEYLAYRNKGFCVFVQNHQQASQAIRGLLSRLRFPIIKDVRLTVLGLPAHEVFPRELPNIHQGETFSIYGRFDEPDKFTMRLVGHNGRQPLDFTFTRDLNHARAGSEKNRKGWAFWKLHHLYSEMIQTGDNADTRKAIDELRQQYDLKTLD